MTCSMNNSPRKCDINCRGNYSVDVVASRPVACSRIRVITHCSHVSVVTKTTNHASLFHQQFICCLFKRPHYTWKYNYRDLRPCTYDASWSEDADNNELLKLNLSCLAPENPTLNKKPSKNDNKQIRWSSSDLFFLLTCINFNPSMDK